MSQDEFKKIAFQMISYAGMAYSSFFNAIESARNRDYDKASEFLNEGEENLTHAHLVQTNLLIKESKGEDVRCGVIMVHAQDHLMNAILLNGLAKEFILLYQKKEERYDD